MYEAYGSTKMIDDEIWVPVDNRLRISRHIWVPFIKTCREKGVDPRQVIDAFCTYFIITRSLPPPGQQIMTIEPQPIPDLNNRDELGELLDDELFFE